MKKIAVIIAGCGHKDGSEITETVSTLISLTKYHLDYQCFAPNEIQKDQINHLTGKSEIGERNLLVEAARITRGKIEDLNGLHVENFDALIFPGGLGVAKNLFSFAYDGRNAIVNQTIKSIILEFNRQNKYIGAICISPLLIALSLKDENKKLILTAGLEESSFSDLKYFGANPEKKKSNEISIDSKNKIVSAPAFMNDASLYEVFEGIDKLVKYLSNHI